MGVRAIMRACFLGLLFCLVSASLASAQTCTYYANPTDLGNCSSPSTACGVAEGIALLTPGDTLCLLDGTYQGASSMAVLNHVQGTAGSLITIRAVNRGGVVIDAENVDFRRGIYVYNDSQYLVIDGLFVKRGDGNIVVSDFDGTGECSPKPSCKPNNITFRFVAAWDAGPTNLSSLFATEGVDTVVEDSAFFTTSSAASPRKPIGTIGSVNPIFRRVFLRYSGSPSVNPKYGYESGYHAWKNTCENCVILFTGDFMNNNTNGVYATDNGWWNPGDVTGLGGPNSERHDAAILGSLFLVTAATYNPPGSVFPAFLLRMGNVEDLGQSPIRLSMNGHDVEHNVFFIDPASTHGASIIPVGLRNYSSSTPLDGAQNQVFSNNTLIGTLAASSLLGTWTTANNDIVTTLGAANNIFTGSGAGGRLCFQYVDRALTATPLWPWPANDFIQTAMSTAGLTPIDLTATVESIFGTIPGACLTSGPPPMPQTAITGMTLTGGRVQ